MTSKIKIRVGEIEVEYEGSDTFLEKKLPDLIGKLSEMAGSVSAPSDEEVDEVSRTRSKKKKPQAGERGTLAAFLKKSNVGNNKTKKFLTTAEWLHLGGKARLKTGDVVKALNDNNQGSVGNASQCLANCVKSGNCQRDGDRFFVTPDGRESLK